MWQKAVMPRFADTLVVGAQITVRCRRGILEKIEQSRPRLFDDQTCFQLPAVGHLIRIVPPMPFAQHPGKIVAKRFWNFGTDGMIGGLRSGSGGALLRSLPKLFTCSVVIKRSMASPLSCDN